MTSTQFVRLLDKTEEMETADAPVSSLRGSMTLPKRLSTASAAGPSGFDSRRASRGEIKSGRRILEESSLASASTASYLDQDARVPFDRLKQVSLTVHVPFVNKSVL